MRSRSAPNDVRHVEMYDGLVFCGACDRSDHTYDYEGINQLRWHEDAEAIGDADCGACLEVIQTLGVTATARLAKLDEIAARRAKQ